MLNMELTRKDLNSNIQFQPRPKQERRKSLTVDLDNEDKLEVEELTRGLKVRTDKPHLVSLGGGRLSTAITLLPLDDGVTRIGSNKDQDICIYGPEIQGEHCYINSNQLAITLSPLNNAAVAVDGQVVSDSVVLNQGCMLCLGRSNYFRFNHPEQAMKLKGSNSNSDHADNATKVLDKEEYSKGQSVLLTSTSSSTDSSVKPSSSKFRDDLAEQSFKNKLKRFEILATPPQEEVMSPPPTTPNYSKFSYLNYVGEKLFTKDTNTTRLSTDEAQINSDALAKAKSVTNGESSQQIKPPFKPEVKPKPAPGPGKSKPKLQSPLGSSTNMATPLGNGRSEFKTLSMISTETSIWGSTSSAGTVRLDDELCSPGSCTTPTEDLLDHPDVFSEEMTNSLTMKHQQMVEERKLEEAMEKKEQERLEEILAMCAQYEEQVDSEKQINSPLVKSDKLQGRQLPHYDTKGTPPKTLGLTSVLSSHYDGHAATLPSQMPDVLSESIQSARPVSPPTRIDHHIIKANGSLLHSPTSPPHSRTEEVFNLSNHSNKVLSTSNPTYTSKSGGQSQNAYQDDQHLYDCPADYNILSESKPKAIPDCLVLTSPMSKSAYEDDHRIYDDPAEVLTFAPPVPSHSNQESSRKVSSSRNSGDSNPERQPHRSMDSSSSELTVVSSACSSNTAAPELPSSFTETVKSEDLTSNLNSLRHTRSTYREKLSKIKSNIMEVETQQSEAVRELEMEQALLQGEQQSELNKLQAQWEEGDMLKSKRLILMNNYAKQQQERSKKIEEARERLQRLEERRVEIEELLRVAADEEKDDLLLEYENKLECLENQKKVFEDLEFQQLEMEAKYEEESEAVQRDLNGKQTDLMSKIKRAEDNLAQMTRQQTDMMEQTRSELEGMERQRKILVGEFQKEKQKMLSLDHKIKDISKHYGNGVLNNTQGVEQDELLLTSPATTMNKNLLSRIKPGDVVMEEERKRLESLKHAATEASIMQWHEQRNLESHLRRRATLDSEEENMSTRSSGTPSDGDKISYNSSMDDQERFAELQMLLAQARHHVQNAESADLAMERRLRMQLEQQLAEEKNKREELEQQVHLRDKSNPNLSMRPLTRYLPVREEKFDLRSHVLSTGHNLGLCPFVEVTPTQCKGYLLKMGTKGKNWNKRWFVFDREKKALLYYMDKSESKSRGGIYFQTIEDVFVDHMRNVKSPNHKFTFCVKTYDKPYYLVAKSPEALSIWIDVIFTGAEGYQEF